MTLLRKKFSTFLTLFVIPASLVIITGSILYYRSELKKNDKEKSRYLQTLSDFKVNELVQWQTERLSEVRFFSSSHPYTSYAQKIVEEDKNADLFRSSLSLIMTDNRYENILILSKEGKIIFSVFPDSSSVNLTLIKYSNEAIKKDSIISGELYYCDIHKKIHYEIIAPLHDKNHKVYASLVFRIIPDDYLYPHIQKWPAPDKTAETLIIRQDGDSIIFLNKLRHIDNSTMSFKIPVTNKEAPAIKAISGYEGIFEGVDYRGEKVLSDIRKIPGTRWYMISKIDKSEIYSDFYKEIILLSIIIFLLILTVGSGASVIYYYRQKLIYKELTNKKNQLKQKDEELKATLYSIGDGVITTDNVGIITQINPVAENLTGWKEDEAKGLKFEKVFHIVEEDTGLAQQNLVDNVLKKGNIIGLTNHTVLISKSGKEIPIADSAAPIKGKRGEILGVVVVFSDQSQQRARQKALKESEERFMHLFDRAPLGYQSLDEDGCFIEVNQAWLDTLEYRREEVIGKWFGDFLTPDYVEAFRNRFPIFKREGKIHSEVEMLTKNGHRKYISFEGRIGHKMDGSFEKIHCILQDITESKEIEKELRISEEKYRSLFHNHSAVKIIIDPDNGNIVDTNEAASGFYGWSTEELKQMNLSQINTLPPEKLKEAIHSARSRKNIRFEFKHRKANGEIRDVEIFSSKIILEGKEFLHSIIHDITEKKEVERALRESEERYRLVLGNSYDAILTTKPDGSVVSANKAACEMFGMTEEEICSNGRKNLVDLTDPNLPPLLKNRELFGKTKGELTFIKKDGKKFPAELTSSVFYDSKGVALTSMIIRDITERVQMEESIRERGKSYRDLIDGMNETIWVIDFEGNIIDVNKTAVDTLGYTKDELIKTNLDKIDAFLTKEKIAELVKLLPDEKFQMFETTHRTKNDKKIPVEIYLSHVSYMGKKSILSIARNISQRKRDEDFQQILYEITSESNKVSDIEDLLVSVKVELSRVIDISIFYVAIYNTNDYNLNRLFLMTDKLNTKEWQYENALIIEILKSGKTMLLDKKELIDYLAEYHKGIEVNIPECWLGVPIKDDLTSFGVIVLQNYMDARAFDSHNVRLLEIIAHELSIVFQRTKMINDLVSAKEKAEESDRLKTAFLANMSHEIRTPMNGILGFLELLQQSQLTSERQEEYLNIVNISGKRLLNTINDIIEISLIESGQSPIDLSDVNLIEIINYLNGFFSAEVHNKGLSLIIKEQELIINTDKFKLISIWSNLLKNAIKFTHEGYIETGLNCEENTITFYVKDTGIGIPKEKIGSIFDRFVQADTRISRQYEGSGLGLAIAKANVELLGGKIWVVSEDKKGSIFYFTLPKSDSTTKSEIKNETKNWFLFSETQKHEGVIMVAEDDDISFRYMADLLKKGNYDVLWAKNGKEAVEMCLGNKTIDLILMDIKMPVMDGIEATQKIREFNKNIPIISQSAYAFRRERDLSLNAGCNDYIAKPVSIKDLVTIIEKYLK